MRFLVLILAILLFKSFTFSQNEEKLYDSLFHILQKAPHDTFKILAIKEIANQTAWFNPERAKKHTFVGLRIAEKINIPKWKATMLFYHGYTFYELRDYKNTLKYYLEACKIWKKLSDKPALSECYSNIGIVYWKTTQLDDALNYYDSAYSINTLIKDTAAQIRNLNNIALVYRGQGNYEKAIANYIKVLEYHENKKNTLKAANVSLNIGVLQLEMKNFKDAETHFIHALDWYKQKDANKNVMETHINLGLLYSRQSRFTKSIEHYKKAWISLKTYPDKELEAIILLNLGSVYKYTENYDLAIKHFRNALELHKQLGNREGIHNSQYSIMESFMMSKNYDSVSVYIDFNTSFIDSVQALKDQRMSHRFLADYYDFKKKPIEALYHFKEYSRLNDSLYNINVNEAVQELNKKYEAEKKQSKINLLESDKKALDLKLSRNLWILFSLIVLFLMIVFVLWLLYKNYRQKSIQAEIQLKHKLMRSQLNPHFIFNSLNAVNNSILMNKNTDAITLLNGFTKLMRNILESSTLELIPLNEEKELLEHYLKLQSIRFNHLFNYQININTHEPLEEILIPPMIGQPFVENAIEHAFKNIQHQGELIISITTHQKKLLYSIEDNGLGIIISQTENKSHKSRALEITNERLKLISKQLKTPASVNLINKQEINSNDTGLRVEIVLPLIFEN